MQNFGKPTSLYVDDETKALLNRYMEKYKLLRNAVLRIIVKKFFERRD